MNIVEIVAPYEALLKALEMWPTITGLRMLEFLVKGGGETYKARDIAAKAGVNRVDAYKYMNILAQLGYIEIIPLSDDFGDRGDSARRNAKRLAYGGNARAKRLYRVSPGALAAAIDRKIAELEKLKCLLAGPATT